MELLSNFIVNNIWLCLGIGAVVVIVGDEVLGVSRALLSDPTDDVPYDKHHREEAAKKEVVDPLDRMADRNSGPSIEDMLRRK